MGSLWLSLVSKLSVVALATALPWGTDAAQRTDGRPNISRKPDPFLPVGVVTQPGTKYYATGFLISPCHVLTVNHVVRGPNSSGKNHLRFRIGAKLAGTYRTSSGTIVSSGGFIEGEGLKARHKDWLLLHLERCLGKEAGYLEIDLSPLSITPKPVRIAGFPSGRNTTHPTVETDCRVARFPSIAVRHDCITSYGNSGSPIFSVSVANGVQRLTVHAMHVAKFPEYNDETSPSVPYRGVAVTMKSIAHIISDHTGLNQG